MQKTLSIDNLTEEKIGYSDIIIFEKEISITFVLGDINAVQTITNMFAKTITNINLYEDDTLVDVVVVNSRKFNDISTRQRMIDNVLKTEATLTLKTPNLLEDLESLKKQLGILNLNDLDLDELKRYKVKLLAEQLAEYKKYNPYAYGSSEYSIEDIEYHRLRINILWFDNQGKDKTTDKIPWHRTNGKITNFSYNGAVNVFNSIDEIVVGLDTYYHECESVIFEMQTREDVLSYSVDFKLGDIRLKESV